jgi:hypothetical protein
VQAEIEAHGNPSMTIKEFQISLDNRVKNLKTFTEPLRRAAFSVTAQMGERIFDEGKTTDSGEIGQYSTKPIYVNPEKLTVKKSIGVKSGKTGEKVFKSGKKKGEPHKTKYLEGGYKELRDKVGRQSSFVDLSFSNELRMDFNNERPVAEPRKINDLEYQIRLDKDINQKKRGGMEEKYGTIFNLSDKEKELFFETIQFEFNNRLSK